jgi:hypothetical protein
VGTASTMVELMGVDAAAPSMAAWEPAGTQRLGAGRCTKPASGHVTPPPPYNCWAPHLLQLPTKGVSLNQLANDRF